MKDTLESPKPPTADQIAELADSGADISRFFSNTGWMMPAILPTTAEFRCLLRNEGDDQED